MNQPFSSQTANINQVNKQPDKKHPQQQQQQMQ